MSRGAAMIDELQGTFKTTSFDHFERHFESTCRVGEAYDNHSLQSEKSVCGIVIPPICHPIRSTDARSCQPIWSTERQFVPRQWCCVSNISVCIVLVTVLALLLFAAFSSLVVIL